MPERVVRLADEVSTLTRARLTQVAGVAWATKILVIAHGRPERFGRVLGADVSREPWLTRGLGTRSGSDDLVDDGHRALAASAGWG